MSKILYPVHRSHNNTAPLALKCPRCKKQKANLTRDDKLCKNCAHFADKSKKAGEAK